eukprot:Skav225658  [mRNA]  locus=scaffold1924:2016:4936:+ [translate_table: standard]
MWPGLHVPSLARPEPEREPELLCSKEGYQFCDSRVEETGDLETPISSLQTSLEAPCAAKHGRLREFAAVDGMNLLIN